MKNKCSISTPYCSIEMPEGSSLSVAEALLSHEQGVDLTKNKKEHNMKPYFDDNEEALTFLDDLFDGKMLDSSVMVLDDTHRDGPFMFGGKKDLLHRIIKKGGIKMTALEKAEKAYASFHGAANIDVIEDYIQELKKENKRLNEKLKNYE